MYEWLRVGNTIVYATPTAAVAGTFWCRTTFTVNDGGVVQAWRWEGNACRSK
jgi:hypothetical protein